MLLGKTGELGCRTAARDRAILHLLVHARLHAGEIIFAEMRDLDMATLTIAEQGKTPGRTVPQNTATQAVLVDYLDKRLWHKAFPSYLFHGRQGTQLLVRSVHQVVARLGEAAGRDVTAKALRNTYPRNLWQSTGGLDLLMERL